MTWEINSLLKTSPAYIILQYFYWSKKIYKIFIKFLSKIIEKNVAWN